MQMTQEKYDDEQEYWATQEKEYEMRNTPNPKHQAQYPTGEEEGYWDIAMDKAYAYASSGKDIKIAREGICVDAYSDGFLDGIAYFITEVKR